jgi:transcriptional regulator with XRE-family HTH domain
VSVPTATRDRETRNPTDWPEFGPALARLRETRGLAKKELARRAGLDASTITRLESGERGVTRETVERLANALDATQKEELDLLGKAGFLADEAVELLAEPELARLAALLARPDLQPDHRALLVRHLRLALDHAAALGYAARDPLAED